MELGKDPIPQMKVINFLKRIVGKPITYDNDFPLRHRVLLLEIQIEYVEDIILTRETDYIGMSRK